MSFGQQKRQQVINQSQSFIISILKIRFALILIVLILKLFNFEKK